MIDPPARAATEPLISDRESRARDILGLNDLEQWPQALPIRVERMWRAENFSPNVPYTGAILIPMEAAPDLARWRGRRRSSDTCAP